jgi:hypothetical protein
MILEREEEILYNDIHNNEEYTVDLKIRKGINPSPITV